MEPLLLNKTSRFILASCILFQHLNMGKLHENSNITSWEDRIFCQRLHPDGIQINDQIIDWVDWVINTPKASQS